MILRDQCIVGECVRVHDAPEGVAEDVRVVPVVESPLELLEVAVHVLGAHLVERADDRPLEQAPDAFYAVRVNVSGDPLFLGMSNSLMARVVVRDSHVRPKLIGVDRFGRILHCPLDEAMEGVLLDVWDSLQADVPSALNGPGDPCLANTVARTDATATTTDQSLIHFYNPEEGRAGERIVAHGFADAVTQMPSCLVGDSECPLELIGGHALLRFTHEVDGEEPLAKRQVRAVHDRSRRHAELVAA